MTGARQARAVERRDLILRAAQELLFEKGMRAVTHRQVAARADVPVGSIGYYFNSRDELLVTALGEANKGWEERLPRLLKAAEPGMSRQQSARLLLDLVVGGEITPQSLRNSVTIAVDCARESPLLQEALAVRRESINSMLAEMLAALGFPTLRTGTLLSTIAGSVAVCIFNQREDIVEVVTDSVVDLLCTHAD